MSSPRLRNQFETLFEHFKGRNSDIRLEDITEILYCTRRNARIVLNKLADQGWIEWIPAAGRGNLSRLNFIQNQNDVSENLAKRHLEEGRIEQALGVLGKDVSRLTHIIHDYLGIQHVAGRQVVRLPYYRPLSMLNPRKPHRRSEQNIIRQIFSGLTKLNEDEQLEPDLAHSWEAINARHWRFYLRSGVKFHNGKLLATEHIRDSLLSLTDSLLYSHIEQVETPDASVVDVLLNRDDWHFPLLLAESMAKILPPQQWLSDDCDIRPVGTGPYRVEVNDDKRLILQAFDGYFGYRPLVDRVEVWVIDESYSSLVFPSLTDPTKPVVPADNEVELDPGCTYLLLNRKSGIARDDKAAAYIASVLNSFALFKALPEETVVELGLLPAHGLKPGWYHSLPDRIAYSPEEGQKVTVAYLAEHPVFPLLAKAIKRLLKQAGFSVELLKYQHKPDKPDEIDIWLKPMGIGTYRDDALAGWLLDYSDIHRFSETTSFAHWQELVTEWRETQDSPFPAKELGKSLVETRQIIPMFHCWLGVSKDQCGALQNAKCNALGWFDFSKVWVKPELN
ncbi:SgrR family transcriptional regulator [Vibrio sp. SCSIO 43137]|uniref:SgrR family transcriptional regulator n=1 Tax=Vibrio sp. SCSIO 43137 TaxID=3021011 RepID=UPI002307422B|nr:SgrR family transcriptional regulator [Vibrio sp. SCSIO 43137]WCE31321.1 SgrR family transcriptional regulator [Vibrio sp. SCSIO 43137]